MITQWIYSDAYSNTSLAISLLQRCFLLHASVLLCVSSLMVVCSHTNVLSHLNLPSVDYTVSPNGATSLIWSPLVLLLRTAFFPLFPKQLPVFLLFPSFLLCHLHSLQSSPHSMNGDECISTRSWRALQMAHSILFQSAHVNMPTMSLPGCHWKKKDLCCAWVQRNTVIERCTFVCGSLASSLLWRSCLLSLLMTANRWRPTALWWRSLSSSPLESPSSPRRSTGLSPLQSLFIQSLKTSVKRAAGCVRDLMWGCLMLFTFQCYFFVSYRALNYLQWPWRYNFLQVHYLVRIITVLYCSQNSQ